MSYWFLASPYSKFEDGLEAAYRLACQQRALLIKEGIPVFSPIVHSHGVAIYGSLDPLDHTIWLPSERPFLETSHGMIACLLPGWEESVGMKAERDYFTAVGKPIIDMEPWRVPPELLF